MRKTKSTLKVGDSVQVKTEAWRDFVLGAGLPKNQPNPGVRLIKEISPARGIILDWPLWVWLPKQLRKVQSANRVVKGLFNIIEANWEELGNGLHMRPIYARGMGPKDDLGTDWIEKLGLDLEEGDVIEISVRKVLRPDSR